MTDDLDPTPEELALQKAKEAAAVPPEPVPDTEGLPDDTKDGEVQPSDPSVADPTDHVDHHEGD